MAMDPVTAGLDLGKSITGLIGEFVEDKDKRNELIYKAQELTHNFNLTLVQTKTIPWVDALIKFLFALKDIILPLMRPVGSALLAGFGAYCATNGIELSEPVQVMLFGSPVAWGASRHANKKQETRVKAKLKSKGVWDDEDDW